MRGGFAVRVDVEAVAAERAYDVSEAAAVKSVSKDFIRDAIKATGPHHLRAKQVGRYLRIRASDLDAWFNGLRDA